MIIMRMIVVVAFFHRSSSLFIVLSLSLASHSLPLFFVSIFRMCYGLIFILIVMVGQKCSCMNYIDTSVCHLNAAAGL